MTDYSPERDGALVFDGHELLAYRSRLPGSLWWFEALAADATLGNPVPIFEALTTGARDGSRTVISRWENREPRFQVVVAALNGAALAEGEAALLASCARPAALDWTPPSGLGETTRFEVQTSWPDHQFDDLEEMDNGTGILRRSYLLSMNAAPFGRSVDPVTLDFPAGVASPTLTLLDAMTSETGWETDAEPPSGISPALSTGTVSGETYLQVDWKASAPGPLYLRKPGSTYPCGDYVIVDYSSTTDTRVALLVDGQTVDSVATTTVRTGTDSEAMRAFFFVGGGSHTLGMSWTVQTNYYGNPSGVTYSYSAGQMRFFDILETDDLPQGLARAVRVPGSARGPWTVRAHESTFEGAPGLGPTLIAVGPKVGTYNPLIHESGAYGATVSFTAPPGSYAVVAMITSAGPSGTLSGQTYTLNTKAGVFRGESRVQVVGRVDFGGGRGGRPSLQSLTFSSDPAVEGALLLIPMDDDHSYVLGDYTGSAYLFCDAPTLTDRGGVFVGDEADGADAVPAWSDSLISQPLEVEAGSTAVYIFPPYADLQLNGFPYWYHHAGTVDA